MTRASLIDHTLLAPTAGRKAVTALCREAVDLGMASVCVNPVHVPLAAEQITRACDCTQAAGADFVKTSTGYSTGGATVHAVEVMHRAVGGSLGIKASGGIHSPEEMSAMLAAGATRIGASAGRALLAQEEQA